MSRKYGSFDVSIDYYENRKKLSKIQTIHPLSQLELSKGWRQVLPKKKLIKVKKDDSDCLRVKTNESFFKINLSLKQLKSKPVPKSSVDFLHCFADCLMLLHRSSRAVLQT